jgi:hypothetical protein
VISHDDVRRIAGSLPGAYEHASFGGRPSWRPTPRMFAWIRQEPEALVVWVSSGEEKTAMIASFRFIESDAELVDHQDYR